MISPKVSSNSNSSVLFFIQNKTYGKHNVTNALEDRCNFLDITEDNDLIFAPSQRILLSTGQDKLYFEYLILSSF